MKKDYFKKIQGSPEPLRHSVTARVRFQETDPLGIVWHGHFASYFEDARVGLGRAYGIGYMDFYSNGILAPIKTMHIDYLHPLEFEEEIRVDALLHWTEAARINNEFIVFNGRGETAATGYTIQMLLNRNFQLYMVQPPFYKKFCDRWKAGTIF